MNYFHFHQVHHDKKQLLQKISTCESCRDQNDYFGLSVEMNGDYLVVGAESDDYDEIEQNEVENAGAAYIFKHNEFSNSWLQVDKIVANDRTASDFFGTNVQIEGDYIIVGNSRDDDDADNLNDLTDAGSVHIFKRDNGLDTWSFHQKITPKERLAEDRFGVSVDINEGFIVVGAHLEDEDGNNQNNASSSGSAYVFKMINGESTFTQVEKFNNSDRGGGDQFGISLAKDANNILVGSWGEDHDLDGNNYVQSAGSAYFFSLNPDPIVKPEIYTESALDESFNSATLSAEIFDGGTSTTYNFEYGLNSEDYSSGTTTSQTLSGSSTTISVESVIPSGLEPNTEYFTVVRAENSVSFNYSSEFSFTTSPANAEAYSNTATNITGFSALITFQVYNGNTFSSATILYGESENSLTLSQDYDGNNINGSTSTITLGQSLNNLDPTTLYYYAIVNSNVNNTATSSSGTFETGFGNPTIAITSITPSSTFADVTFDAFNAEQSATITYWLSETEGDYASNSFSYDGNPFGANSSTQSLDQTISNLNIETEYFYYFEIDNGLASSTTSESSFWTLSTQPSHSNTFYQIGEALSTIEIGFESLANSGAKGYIILQSATTPDTYPSNGTAYQANDPIGNSSIAMIITDDSWTSATITELPRESSYIFTLIPYNWDETNPETYNYNITDTPTITGFTIPTLGEWGMIAFGGLMLIGGVWWVRRTV
jgi:hypothetical protein